MERPCEYCKKSFEPKRIDTVYCSHSCRQMAYVLRKTTLNVGIEGLKGLPYKSDTSNTIRKEQDLSIDSEKKIEQFKLTVKEQEASIINPSENKYPSIDQTEPSINENVLSVKIDKTETINSEIKPNSNDTKVKKEEPFKEYDSPYIMELAELTEERDNLSKLSVLLYNNRECSAYWISLRYKCLIECLLTLSEMKQMELDDLKEVCNAMTSIIQSRSYNYLPQRYPYTNDIMEIRDSIKNFCLKANGDEPIKLEFKKATKLKMLATRWELANYVPKESFSQLDFKE